MVSCTFGLLKVCKGLFNQFCMSLMSILASCNLYLLPGWGFHVSKVRGLQVLSVASMYMEVKTCMDTSANGATIMISRVSDFNDKGGGGN